MKSVRIVVTGKVQKVHFRLKCLSESEKLGIRGWAFNMPDGTLEIQAEGTEEAVNKFIDWCRKGPKKANIQEIRITPSLPTGMGDFQIPQKKKKKNLNLVNLTWWSRPLGVIILMSICTLIISIMLLLA